MGQEGFLVQMAFGSWLLEAESLESSFRLLKPFLE